jgi:hypothetical protein
VFTCLERCKHVVNLFLLANDVNDKNQITAIIVDVSKTIYRLGHSDTFACHSCEKKGDKWFMQQHNCSNKSRKI